MKPVQAGPGRLSEALTTVRQGGLVVFLFSFFSLTGETVLDVIWSVAVAGGALYAGAGLREAGGTTDDPATRSGFLRADVVLMVAAPCYAALRLVDNDVVKPLAAGGWLLGFPLAAWLASRAFSRLCELRSMAAAERWTTAHQWVTWGWLAPAVTVAVAGGIAWAVTGENHIDVTDQAAIVLPVVLVLVVAALGAWFMLFQASAAMRDELRREVAA